MRFQKSAAVAGTALILGGFGASAASAAATLSSNVIYNNGTPAQRTITVSFSGQPANSVVFIEQCKKPQDDPTFIEIQDCSQTGINPSANASGSGSAEFTVFVGDEPFDAGWSCGPGSTALPSTGTIYSTCWVRLASGVNANISTDESYPITFTDTPPVPTDVPEVPLNVLLPLSAAAVLGGAYFVTHKRKLNAAA